MTLQPQSTVIDQNSNVWTIEKFLGSGTQGEVYSVRNGTHLMALKWYFDHKATEEQRQALEILVMKGSPSNRFLWPLLITKGNGSNQFGYIMPLREERFKSIPDFLKWKVETSFYALCTTCFELAHHYQLLHSLGLAYRDISFGNLFFDPSTGDIRIADNDNVCVNGSGVSSVLGTPRFMAPEIVRREAEPSADTDLYSLSVLLFYMLFLNHPLEGEREASIRCLDLPAMNKLYGTEPVFIFDPNNLSNRPRKGYHDNANIYWQVYPEFIKSVFTRAFTDGLDPSRRVRETEWRRVLIALRDSIILGPRGDENFFDADRLLRGETHICWATKQPIILPPRLKIGNLIVCLTLKTRLYKYHMTQGKDFNFETEYARVILNPHDAAIIGLENVSSDQWTYQHEDGSLKIIPPGKRITLKNGLKINFGPVHGTVSV